MKKSFARELYGASRLPVSLEPMEARLLLADPVFATPLADAYTVPATYGRTIGIDGADQDSVPLTITAVSDNPLLQAYVTANTQYALMHFVQPPASGTGAPTVIGDILVQLFDTQAGDAVQHFITLATQFINPDGSIGVGDPFYTNVVVHRVIPNFMIQTGDAANGDGTGGSPLGAISDSFAPDLGFAGSGVLAMANSGENSSDAQFFITQAPYEFGNGKYIIFGQVIYGMDILNQVINVPRDTSNDRPNNPPVLSGVDILSSPEDGTVVLVAQEGLTGVSHVTITLDNGSGGIVQKTITVLPESELPVLGSVSDKHLAPGQSTTFVAPVFYSQSPPLSLTGTADNGAIVSVDGDTRVVTVTAPAGFYGMVKVALSVTEAGDWADLSPATTTFNAFVDGLANRPEASRIPADAASQSTAMASAQAGDFLYVCMGDGGLAVYNVADPANPIQVGAISTRGTARDIKIVGATAYIANTSYGIAIVDITDPANPVLLGNASAGSSVIEIAIRGNVLWAADYTAGATAYDITDPRNPVKITSVKKITDKFSLSYIYSVAIKDNLLYACDAAGIVVLIDVTDPANPVPLTGFAQDLATNTWNIAISGNRLFLAAEGLLAAYDIGKPQLGVKKLGQIAVPGIWKVSVFGNEAIVARDSGFSFVDVTKPSKMVVKETFVNRSVYANAMIFGGSPSIAGKAVSLPMGADGLVLLENTTSVTNGSVSLRDGNNRLVKFTIAGGTARLHTSGPGSGDIGQIEIAGSALTSVTMTSAGGTTTVGSVAVSGGSLKGFTARTTNLIGDFTVDGSLESLSLYDVGGGTIRIAGTAPGANAAAATAMSFHNVNDASIDTELPVKSLRVGNWTDNPATPSSIAAPWIGTLIAKGNLPVDLDLSGLGAAAATLGKATIAGGASGADWRITGAVGSVKISGGATAWQLIGGSGGDLTDIASLTLGGITNGTIDSTGSIKTMKAAAWQGGSITGVALTSLSIAGNYSDSTLTLTRGVEAGDPKVLALGKLAVIGQMDNVEVRTAGSIGSVTAGAMADSLVLAGLRNGISELPTGRSDFSVIDDALLPVLGSLTVKTTFGNSVVAAWAINKTLLKTIQTDNTVNGNRKFGLAGHTVVPYVAAAANGDFEVRIL